MQIGLNLVGAVQVLVAEGLLLPQLVASPTITGSGREGTSIFADTADTWTYDAAQAIVSARKYRLLIDGTQIVGPQGAASVSVPTGTVGGSFMMQLRVRVAAAAGVWSASHLTAAQIIAASVGSGGVQAKYEIDVEAGTAVSRNATVVLSSGTYYAHMLYQAGGGVDTVAAVRTVAV